MARLTLAGRLRTLVWLRFTIWRHGLRRRGKLVDAVVGAILNLIGIGAAIGLAFALGALVHTAVQSGDDDVLSVSFLIAFWLLAFFAVIVPIFVSGGPQRLKVSRLAIFPIPRPGLYVLALVSSSAAGGHLLWYPALGAATLFAVILPPVDHVPGLILALLLGLTLVAWSHTIQLLLEAVMRKRRVKELLVIGAFTLLVGTSLLPALVDSGALGLRRKPVLVDIMLEVLRPVAEVLPPSLTARGLAALHMGNPPSAWPAIGWIAVWLAAAVALGYAVLSRALLEGGSTSSPASGRQRRAASHGSPGTLTFDPLGWLPGGLAAVMVKELRYLLRSIPGKLSLLLAPIFVVMISLAVGKLMFAKETLFGIEPGSYALYGVLLYAALLSANFFLNSFAWEGPGIATYLISPLPRRHVILGKNLGVVIFQLLVLTESLAVWSLIRGFPDAVTAVNGVLVFACAVLILMPAGNFVSIAFPVKRSISSISISSSQIGTLVSFAAVLVSAALVGALLVLGLAIGGGPAQVVLLALLVTALLVANALLLGPAGDLLESRSEQLLEALAGSGGDSE